VKIRDMLLIVARVAALLGVAILAGVGGVVASAIVGHELLVMRYGEDLAAIDDTLPMILAVRMSLLVGVASGVLVLAVGGWRLIRRRRPRPDSGSDDGPRD
jgi:hypothetical protein